MRRSTKALLAAAWTGILILSVVAAADAQQRASHEADVWQDTREQLDVVRANLDEALDRRIAATGRLSAFVALQPEVDAEAFRAYAGSLAAEDASVRSLHLERTDGTRFAFPEGTTPLAGTEASSAGGPRVSGPHGARGGVQTVLVSAPVHLPGPGRVLWGVAAIEVYLEPLYGEAKILGWPGDAVFALRGADGVGASGGAFFGPDTLFGGHAATAALAFPGGEWQMAAAPTDGWPDVAPSSWWIRLGGGLVALLAAVLVGVLVSEPDRLRRAVTHATEAARESERHLHHEKERFRALSEAAFEGIAIHEDGRIVEVNTAFARLFGRAPEELVEARVLDLIAPDSRSAVARRLEKPDDEPYEIEGLRRDGTAFTVEVAAKDFPFQDRIVRVVAVRDITERKKAEAAQRVALERLMEIERLKEVDEFKTQLLNTASHELNTPITPIRLQLYLLKNRALGELSPKHLKAIDVLDRNVERLAALVQDVLDVARLQSGRLRMTRAPLDLEGVARDALEAFEEPANQAGLVLESHVDADLWVMADGHRLTQVLFNLLSNALKFTPREGRVCLTVRREERAAVVRVEDSGIGMTEAQVRKLFRPFSQAHDTMERTRSGTGLGLYISKGIVEEHQGRIWVESRGPGRGTVFGFSLPLAGRDELDRSPQREEDAAA